MLKLSIIVPVYNVELYLNKCIDSILNQTFTDFELLLINDGSTDSSGVICSEYLEKDSRIKLLVKENGGLSSARNLGLAHAKGEYIAFVDSDDWIDVNMYESMINAIVDNNVDIVVCGHSVVNLDNSVNEINTTEESVLYTGEEATKLILNDEKIFSFAWDKLYKKELFKGIFYPEGRIYEDTATTYKLFYRAKSVFHLNKSFYYYVRRNDSICHEGAGDVLRAQHNFSSFHERYLFFKVKPRYSSVLDKCEYTVLKMGINLLHYNARVPELFSDVFFIQQASLLKEMNIEKNSLVPIKYRLELGLLSISTYLYRNLLGFFFLIKK